MKKNKLALVVVGVVVGLGFVLNAQAAGKKTERTREEYSPPSSGRGLDLHGTWEVTAGATGGLLAPSAPTGGLSILSGGGSTTTVFQLNAQVGLILDNGLEPFATPTLVIASGGGTSTTFSLIAGVAYNFWKDTPLDSPYAQLGLGIFASSGTTSMLIEFGGGKRFQLSGKLSYSPQAALDIFTSGGLVAINLIPVRFSLMF